MDDEQLGSPSRPVVSAPLISAEDRAIPQREGPLLGLATTRQLLEELRARGDVEFRTGAQYRLSAGRMSDYAASLLAELPAPVLDYRTVDG